MNIHSIGNMEITTRHLMKECIPIVRMCNGDVFLKMRAQMLLIVLSWALVMTFQI
jgi:hypothetical protein